MLSDDGCTLSPDPNPNHPGLRGCTGSGCVPSKNKPSSRVRVRVRVRARVLRVGVMVRVDKVDKWVRVRGTVEPSVTRRRTSTS